MTEIAPLISCRSCRFRPLATPFVSHNHTAVDADTKRVTLLGKQALLHLQRAIQWKGDGCLGRNKSRTFVRILVRDRAAYVLLVT